MLGVAFAMAFWGIVVRDDYVGRVLLGLAILITNAAVVFGR